MNDRPEEGVYETSDSFAGALIHGIMDHIKGNWNTVTNSSASIGERSLAGVELCLEGAGVAAAMYGLGRLGCRILGGTSDGGALKFATLDSKLRPMIAPGVIDEKAAERFVLNVDHLGLEGAIAWVDKARRLRL